MKLSLLKFAFWSGRWWGVLSKVLPATGSHPSLPSFQFLCSTDALSLPRLSVVAGNEITSRIIMALSMPTSILSPAPDMLFLSSSRTASSLWSAGILSRLSWIVYSRSLTLCNQTFSSASCPIFFSHPPASYCSSLFLQVPLLAESSTIPTVP